MKPHKLIVSILMLSLIVLSWNHGTKQVADKQTSSGPAGKQAADVNSPQDT